MTNPERVDKAIESDRAARLDRVEQVTHRDFAETLLRQQVVLVLLLQGEDVRRLLHPFFVEEQLDLFLAKPLDIEGAARAEQFEMLDFLEWTGEFARAA